MREVSFSEFMNRFVKVKTLVLAFAFAIIVSAGAVWWGHYQGVMADQHICSFADASRRSQILTAGDSARALVQTAALGNFDAVGTPENRRARILEQLNQYVRGDLDAIPEGLHPQIAQLFRVGRSFVLDAERRVRERLPEVGVFVPLCADVEFEASEITPTPAAFLTPLTPGLLAAR